MLSVLYVRGGKKTWYESKSSERVRGMVRFTASRKYLAPIIRDSDYLSYVSNGNGVGQSGVGIQYSIFDSPRRVARQQVDLLFSQYYFGIEYRLLALMLNCEIQCYNYETTRKQSLFDKAQVMTCMHTRA